jgi:hypothetical protein
MVTAHPAQQGYLGVIERRTDCAVPDDAGSAMIHLLALAAPTPSCNLPNKQKSSMRRIFDRHHDDFDTLLLE